MPAASAGDTSVGDCVRFGLTRTEPEVADAVDSPCGIPASHTLSWRLVCGDDEWRREDRPGPATSSRHAGLALKR